MRKSKFSEHQIIAILKAVEAGRAVKDICREHEVSDATYSVEAKVRRHGSRRHSAANVSWKMRTGAENRCMQIYPWRTAR